MPIKKMKSDVGTIQKKSTKKVTIKEEIKPKKAPEKDSNKENEFSFGTTKNDKTSIPKRMTKEEREDIINKALQPKEDRDLSKYEWKIEDSDYNPNKWVVIITPEGFIYQEPVPRYWNYDTFVNILASIPDKPLDSYNKINFSSEICKTSFEVKDIECYIITVPSEGSRKRNTYGTPFNIKNSTKYIGGNIVFSGGDNGFTKKQATKVVEQIIKTLNNYEEIITAEDN